MMSISSFQVSKVIKILLPEDIIFGGGTQKAQITLRWELNLAPQVSPSSRGKESSRSHLLHWKWPAAQGAFMDVTLKIWGTRGCAETYSFTGDRQTLGLFYWLPSQHGMHRCLEIHLLLHDHYRTTQQHRPPLDQGSLSFCAKHTGDGEEKKELGKLCSTRSVFGNKALSNGLGTLETNHLIL